MKKNTYLLIIVLLISMATSYAQWIPPTSIEDSVFGWMKVYNFKGLNKGLQVDDKIYSANQISICDSFANWMQASYIPKGALGDIKKVLSPKLGLYNQNHAALPQRYGVSAPVYIFLRYNSKKKIEPATNDATPWSIIANEPIGVEAMSLCTPSQYYFTLPSFAEQGYDDELPKLYGLAKHPNTKKYFTYFRRNSHNGNEKTVLLCKDNQLPFIKITKGEYLQVIEAAISRKYEDEKKSISEKNGKDQRSIDYFMKYLNEKNEKRLATLKINKEKYKNRLQEVAEIFTTEPDIMLENYPDVFTGSGGRSLKLPVYKIDPTMAELCKKDKPQWIVVTWHGDINDPVGKHQHEAIINNFNFDYLYNFFFDPEKVKGQPYKPLRSPLYKEAVVVTNASETSKKNLADKNIYFFEDFSTTGIGQKPIGWKSNLGANGSRSVITNLDGLGGNWAVVADFTLTPGEIKKPLPQNFTLSFDVVVAQNFTWGAKRLHFKLAKETTPGNAESFLDLGIRPGYDGRDGDVSLETKFPSPPGYSNGANSFEAPGFSNNKKNNRILVTIKKMDETLRVFINNTKIAEYEKAIPAAHLFNALSFFSYNSGANDKYYISNIKITKD